MVRTLPALAVSGEAALPCRSSEVEVAARLAWQYFALRPAELARTDSESKNSWPAKSAGPEPPGWALDFYSIPFRSR